MGDDGKIDYARERAMELAIQSFGGQIQVVQTPQLIARAQAIEEYLKGATKAP